MNWRAVGIGAAVNVLFWFAGAAASVLLPLDSDPTVLRWWLWIGPLFGSLGDIASGAIAGWIAAARGWLHGALAVVAGSVVALVGAMALGYVRMGGDVSYLFEPSYWASALGWVALGVALGTIAGAIGAQHAPANPNPV